MFASRVITKYNSCWSIWDLFLEKSKSRRSGWQRGSPSRARGPSGDRRIGFGWSVVEATTSTAATASASSLSSSSSSAATASPPSSSSSSSTSSSSGRLLSVSVNNSKYSSQYNEAILHAGWFPSQLHQSWMFRSSYLSSRSHTHEKALFTHLRILHIIRAFDTNTIANPVIRSFTNVLEILVQTSILIVFMPSSRYWCFCLVTADMGISRRRGPN